MGSAPSCSKKNEVAERHEPSESLTPTGSQATNSTRHISGTDILSDGEEFLSGSEGTNFPPPLTLVPESPQVVNLSADAVNALPSDCGSSDPFATSRSQRFTTGDNSLLSGYEQEIVYEPAGSGSMSYPASLKNASGVSSHPTTPQGLVTVSPTPGAAFPTNAHVQGPH